MRLPTRLRKWPIKTADREPGLPDVGDEDEARGWVAAAVSLFAAATSGAALGADLAHSEVAKCAVTLLIALHALFRVK